MPARTEVIRLRQEQRRRDRRWHTLCHVLHDGARLCAEAHYVETIEEWLKDSRLKIDGCEECNA